MSTIIKEWKYSTIRPRPNSMHSFEADKPGHRLGYKKRVSNMTGETQYQPRCFGCKWVSEHWYKARNEASRREWISHAVSVSTQASFPTMG